MTKTTGLVALKTQNFLAVVKTEFSFCTNAISKNTFSFNTKPGDCKRFWVSGSILKLWCLNKSALEARRKLACGAATGLAKESNPALKVRRKGFRLAALFQSANILRY